MNILSDTLAPIPLRAWSGALALLLFALPFPTLGQQPAALPVGVELEATRPALEAALARLDGEGASPMAEAIRLRLSSGDFRAGDQVALTVDGEADLTRTFSVEEGPVLVLPLVGELSLAGVLRAELEDHLTGALATILRDPVVRARSLIQVSILGEVTRPGFYMVTPDALLSEAFMEAGGPTQEAKMDKLRIERAQEGAWVPPETLEGSLEARSVNELGLRNGDRVVVPGGPGFWGGPAFQASVLGLTAIVSIIRFF